MKEFHKRRIHKRREHVQWRNFSPEKETITARSISRDFWITSNRAKFPRRMSSSNHLLWRNFSPKKALRKDRSIFDAKNWSCHRRNVRLLFHRRGLCRSVRLTCVDNDGVTVMPLLEENPPSSPPIFPWPTSVLAGSAVYQPGANRQQPTRKRYWETDHGRTGSRRWWYPSHSSFPSLSPPFFPLFHITEPALDGLITEMMIQAELDQSNTHLLRTLHCLEFFRACHKLPLPPVPAAGPQAAGRASPRAHWIRPESWGQCK